MMKIVVLDRDTNFIEQIRAMATTKGWKLQSFNESNGLLAEVAKIASGCTFILSEESGGKEAYGMLFESNTHRDSIFILTSKTLKALDLSEKYKRLSPTIKTYSKQDSLSDLVKTIEGVPILSEPTLSGISIDLELMESAPKDTSSPDSNDVFHLVIPEVEADQVSEKKPEAVESVESVESKESSVHEISIITTENVSPSVEISPVIESKPIEISRNDGVSSEIKLDSVIVNDAPVIAEPVVTGSILEEPVIEEPSVEFSVKQEPIAQNIGIQSTADADTVKKYLQMREHDISVLSVQMDYAKQELQRAQDQISKLSAQNADLVHQLDHQKSRAEELEKEKFRFGTNLDGEKEQLKAELKNKIDRIRYLEERVKDSENREEGLKEKVRTEIRKIRVREKELENRLEILKKDSETLISSREQRILELKRRIDILEFNYDTLQEKTDLEKKHIEAEKERIQKALKALRLSVGILEGDSGGAETANLKSAGSV